jgi:hypothetical protein
MARQLAQIVGLFVLIQVVGGTAHAAHVVTVESVDPAIVTKSTPTLVTARVRIEPEPSLIRNSVRLLKVPETGAPVSVCVMADDGNNGDTTAGDSIFTCRFQVNEAQPRQLAFRASVAYLGEIRRFFSQDAHFLVLDNSTPANSRASLAAALSQGDLVRARQFLGDARVKTVAAMDAGGRAQLAAALMACVPLKNAERYHLCVDPSQRYRFALTPDYLNVWRVQVW